MLTGYLAGPIENLTIGNATSWRKSVTEKFAGLIKFHNPMYGKEQIVSGKRLIKQENYSPETFNLTKPDSIFNRDLVMINNSQFILVNLLNPTKFPKGTMFEIGYAYAMRKLVVIIASDPAITEHPFIKQSSVQFTSFETAFEFLQALAEDFS